MLWKLIRFFFILFFYESATKLRTLLLFL